MKKLMWIAPLALVGIALFVFLGGEFVKLLWNWLLPPLFGWPKIGFWQALGLLALCRILFGSFGMRPAPRGRIGQRLTERWATMTPEERARFREGLRERAGFGPSAGGSESI